MYKIYRIGEFAERIGKTTKTIRRWDESGVLPAKRTVGGHRYYDEADLRAALRIDLPSSDRKTVVYCRVSSKGQLNDLKSQRDAMETFCLNAGMPVDEWIEEIGGGMNFKRKKFLEIMQRIEYGELSHLVIAHKDRFVRFGFDYFELFAQRHRCEIVVANQEKLSPHQEMVEDLMAIIHTFSGRLYGLRSYKKKIREAAEHG